jgi:hypothetical protein
VRALREWVASGACPRPRGAAEARALVLAAQAQGVAALLDEAIRREPGPWPRESLQRLRQAHRAAAFRGEQQRELLGRARGLLADAGIRSLPLKGAALVGCAYEAPAERPMDDVDLLALERFDEALAALRRAGFQALEHADHASALRDSASGGVLELHRGLATCPELFPVACDALWSRRLGAPGEERPSNEDLLVQLSVHAAFQHGLQLRLVQFLDFRRLLERQRLEERRLLESAAVSRAEACLLAALEAAAHVVGAAAPEPLLRSLRQAAPARLLRKLERLRREPPERLLDPGSPRSLAGWRLALVGSRRLQLLLRTLAPRGSERAGARLRRGLQLARRLRRAV